MKFFSVGPNCNVAHQLRTYELRKQAGPFDWTGVHQLNVHLCAGYIEGSRPFMGDMRIATIGGSVRLVNADDFQFPHHDVRIDEQREAMQRRLDRVREAVSLGEAVLVSQVSLFGDAQGNIGLAERHNGGIRLLRSALASLGGEKCLTVTVARHPAPNRLFEEALARLSSLLGGRDILVPMLVKARNGYDDPGVWDFLNLFNG